MQVFHRGSAVSDEQFFSSAAEAFKKGAEALEKGEGDEVRVKLRHAPKKRGIGVTRRPSKMSKRKRKAQRAARRTQR